MTFSVRPLRARKGRSGGRREMSTRIKLASPATHAVSNQSVDARDGCDDAMRAGILRLQCRCGDRAGIREHSESSLPVSAPLGQARRWHFAADRCVSDQGGHLFQTLLRNGPLSTEQRGERSAGARSHFFRLHVLLALGCSLPPCVTSCEDRNSSLGGSVFGKFRFRLRRPVRPRRQWRAGVRCLAAPG